MTNKRSLIAHRNHSFYNPISEQKITNIIRQLRLNTDTKTLDIGCGNGEVLRRIAQQYTIHATGIDICQTSIQNAIQNSQQFPNIHFIACDAKEHLQTLPLQTLDLAICLGSSHALGGYKSALQQLQPYMKKNGQIVFAEGYWKQKPHPNYLEILQAQDDDYLYHWQNVQLAVDQGLIPLYSYTASEEDFDNYEWTYSRSIEDYVLENPQDPDNESMLKHIRWWRENYLKYGRSTLGFAIYLFSVA